nr:MAG TPA: hypothetical protein [Caudoviricetes sp.]
MYPSINLLTCGAISGYWLYISDMMWSPTVISDAFRLSNISVSSFSTSTALSSWPRFSCSSCSTSAALASFKRLSASSFSAIIDTPPSAPSPA